LESEKQQDNYKKLCHEADILLLDNPSHTLIATSWLHVLRDHTALTKKYENFINDKNILFLVCSLLKKLAFNFLYSILSILKGLKYQSQSSFQLPLNNKSYVSNRAGHSDISTTARIYAHYMPEQYDGYLQEAMDKLQALQVKNNKL